MAFIDLFRSRPRRRFSDKPGREGNGGGRPGGDDGLSQLPNIIGTGAHLQGDLSGSGSFHVHGRVSGNCDVDGRVVVKPGAVWQGNIAATDVIIAGRVEGDVLAHHRLELTASARIHGDVACPSVAIAEGAEYAGQLRTAKRTQVKRFKEQRDASHNLHLASTPTSQD